MATSKRAALSESPRASIPLGVGAWVWIVAGAGPPLRFPRAVACRCSAVKQRVDNRDLDDGGVLLFSNVTPWALEQVMYFCRYEWPPDQTARAMADEDVEVYNDPFPLSPQACYHVSLEQLLARTDHALDPNALCELAAASYHLRVKCLEEMTCRALAESIRGKTPEEIRRTFSIETDFSPEEEDQVHREVLEQALFCNPSNPPLPSSIQRTHSGSCDSSSQRSPRNDHGMCSCPVAERRSMRDKLRDKLKRRQTLREVEDDEECEGEIRNNGCMNSVAHKSVDELLAYINDDVDEFVSLDCPTKKKRRKNRRKKRQSGFQPGREQVGEFEENDAPNAEYVDKLEFPTFEGTDDRDARALSYRMLCQSPEALDTALSIDQESIINEDGETFLKCERDEVAQFAATLSTKPGPRMALPLLLQEQIVSSLDRRLNASVGCPPHSSCESTHPSCTRCVTLESQIIALTEKFERRMAQLESLVVASERRISSLQQAWAYDHSTLSSQLTVLTLKHNSALEKHQEADMKATSELERLWKRQHAVERVLVAHHAPPALFHHSTPFSLPMK